MRNGKEKRRAHAEIRNKGASIYDVHTRGGKWGPGKTDEARKLSHDGWHDPYDSVLFEAVKAVFRERVANFGLQSIV